MERANDFGSEYCCQIGLANREWILKVLDERRSIGPLEVVNFVRKKLRNVAKVIIN